MLIRACIYNCQNTISNQPTRLIDSSNCVVDKATHTYRHHHTTSSHVNSLRLLCEPAEYKRRRKRGEQRKLYRSLKHWPATLLPTTRTMGEASDPAHMRTRKSTHAFHVFAIFVLRALCHARRWSVVKKGEARALLSRALLPVPSLPGVTCTGMYVSGKYAIVLWSATSWVLIYYTPCSHAVDHVVSAGDVEAWLFGRYGDAGLLVMVNTSQVGNHLMFSRGLRLRNVTLQRPLGLMRPDWEECCRICCALSMRGAVACPGCHVLL